VEVRGFGIWKEVGLGWRGMLNPEDAGRSDWIRGGGWSRVEAGRGLSRSDVEVRGFWDLERCGVRLERYVEARECVRGEAIGSVTRRCVVLGSGKRWG
jgi:hypothetical protein